MQAVEGVRNAEDGRWRAVAQAREDRTRGSGCAVGEESPGGVPSGPSGPASILRPCPGGAREARRGEVASLTARDPRCSEEYRQAAMADRRERLKP